MFEVSTIAFTTQFSPPAPLTECPTACTGCKWKGYGNWSCTVLHTDVCDRWWRADNRRVLVSSEHSTELPLPLQRSCDVATYQHWPSQVQSDRFPSGDDSVPQMSLDLGVVGQENMQHMYEQWQQNYVVPHRKSESYHSIPCLCSLTGLFQSQQVTECHVPCFQHAEWHMRNVAISR